MRATSRKPVDVALLAAGALVAGAIASVAPWEVLAATLAALVLVARARRAPGHVWLAVAVVPAMLVGALRAHAAVVRHEQERAEADRVVGAVAVCSARAVVQTSPVRQRGGIRFDAWLGPVSCPDRPVAWAGRATLYGGPDDLARGDELDVVATLAAPQRLWNASSGDPRAGEARRGVVRSGGAIDVRVIRRALGPLAWIDHLRARLRARIEATFDPDLAPMVRALVLGESDLAPEDDLAFRSSGLSHLLAVSGMHLVLVLAFGVRTFEGILSRVESVAARVDVGRVAAAVGVPVAWIYADLAGAGGSTVRAAWMTTAALVSRAGGRRTDGTRAFALSLGVMAGLDPLVAFDLSFALSAAATAGLLAFSEPLAARFASRMPVRLAPVATAVATTLGASAPCAPIIARFAPGVPLGGVIANLLAVPLGECAALPLCFAHALLWWWPAAERGSAAAASGALLLVRAIARVFAAPRLVAEVPQPTSWQLAVLAVALGAFALRAGSRTALAAGGIAVLLALEIGARRSGAPRRVLRATFFDVGQGDAALLDLPSGEAVLIDGGGLVGSPIDIGARVLAPELRARRRGDLLAAILTHPHPDHFGGLVSGLDGVNIGALWDTGEGEHEQIGGAYPRLLGRARARGIPILGPADLCGPHTLGDARVEVLAPCPDFSSDRGPNDNSFVLRIGLGARALLFVGDAEREEEAILLGTARDRLRADVLKVGHHGSRTSSTPAFLAAVAPKEAIISVGCRNRFGHPSERTLAALTAAGARVWRTDLDGAVTVTTDGRSLEVRALAPGH